MYFSGWVLIILAEETVLKAKELLKEIGFYQIPGQQRQNYKD